MGLNELSLRAGIVGIGIGNSQLLARVRTWAGKTPEQAEDAKSAGRIPQVVEEIAREFGDIAILDQAVEREDDGVKSGSNPTNPDVILSAGIQDVTTSLVGDFNINDVLQMVLETIYRGMGFNHAIILIKDIKQDAMVEKFGFGEGVAAVIPRFRFPLSSVPDVFHLSIEKGLDIAIEDIHAPNIADKIPAWYRTSINAPCFMLLPIMIKNKSLGLFYADMLKPNALNMSQNQLSMLRTLRNQAVLAIKQKT